MMYRVIYPEYELCRKKLWEAQNEYSDVLLEEEYLFSKTQPNAIRYDKEHVSGGKSSDILENYVIAKEIKRIDNKKAYYKRAIKERKLLLEQKEEELKKSKDRYDIIYRMRYLDGDDPKEISEKLGYSLSQTYRILGKITESIDRYLAV